MDSTLTKEDVQDVMDAPMHVKAGINWNQDLKNGSKYSNGKKVLGQTLDFTRQ
jgi:hypothetical protein